MPFLPTLAPRCLRIFDPRQVPQVDAGIPEEYSFNAYCLRCSCGNDAWSVFGLPTPDGLQLDDPLTIECDRCKARSDLIDRRRDGYDAEIQSEMAEWPIEPAVLWACPNCGATAGQLLVAVGYQYEPFDSHEPEARHAEDYFDAFLVKHRCRRDAQLVAIAALECA